MIHPIDYRYKIDELEKYISPEAILRYNLRVEIAYITALKHVGVCSKSVLEEYEKVQSDVTLERVLELEEELKHDIKAMVEALREQVSPSARPFCHLGLTSYDIVVNTQALLIREVSMELLVPAVKRLVLQLIELARSTKDAVQIGRTHGQHAEPTTFGYTLTNYIERLGRGMKRIIDIQSTFRGKIAGAVGTKAAIDLLGDASTIEAETLGVLGLPRVQAPSQVANQEELANFYSQLLLFLSTLADLANDFRQLQRTEIGEVYESTTDRQVGSSTMPQKRNPIGWENIISHFKAMTPRLTTSYLNIISEHQRDLTDSAANRYLLAELLNTFLYCVERSTKLLSNLQIDAERLQRNLERNHSFELAEPVYILLALQGVENAHKVVRDIATKARKKGISFKEALEENESFRKHQQSLTHAQRDLLADSSLYTGRASEITETVCAVWERVMRGVE